jgi:hypothetical protein
MKPRFSVYLSDRVAARLALAAKRPGANRSAIIDTALDRFLNPERDTTGDAALLRRLDRMSRQLDRVDRDLGIVTETVTLYIRYYLTITPPLASGDQEAARALGRVRFETFVAQVGKRVASGAKLAAEVMERVSTANPDLFTHQIEEGAPLGVRGDDRGKGSRAPDVAGTAPGRSPAGRQEVGHV